MHLLPGLRKEGAAVSKPRTWPQQREDWGYCSKCGQAHSGGECPDVAAIYEAAAKIRENWTEQVTLANTAPNMRPVPADLVRVKQTAQPGIVMMGSRSAISETGVRDVD